MKTAAKFLLLVDWMATTENFIQEKAFFWIVRETQEEEEGKFAEFSKLFRESLANSIVCLTSTPLLFVFIRCFFCEVNPRKRLEQLKEQISRISELSTRMHHHIGSNIKTFPLSWHDKLWLGGLNFERSKHFLKIEKFIPWDEHQSQVSGEQSEHLTVFGWNWRYSVK